MDRSGLIAGAIAKLIMPGDDPGGIIITMLIGIVGAVIGGFLGSRFFGIGLENFWSLQTWIVAIIGSLILLESIDSSPGVGQSRADHHPAGQAGSMQSGLPSGAD